MSDLASSVKDLSTEWNFNLGLSSEYKFLKPAVGAFGAISDSVSNISSAWSNFSVAGSQSEMQKANAWLLRQNAEGNLDDAAESVRMAGEVQKSGMDATTNRYLRLGQDVGRMYSGAAGSGISVSSAVARNVDRSARMMAGRDVAAMAHTTAEGANRYVSQSKNQRLAYVNDMTNARMMEIQADYNKKSALAKAQGATFAEAEKAVGGVTMGLLL